MKQEENCVYILCGLPASGKSTWAKEYLAKNLNAAKVGRDDFRYMLRNQGKCEPKVEEMIVSLMDYTIIQALKKRMTVLIDNTNLKVSVINHFIELCKYYADVKFMVFDVPAKTCIERDKNRERSVGDDAINKMNEDWKITRDSYAFQDLKRVPEWKRPTIEPFMSHEKPNAVIFDIDGTIALMHNRGPYDWDKVDRDRVNEIVVDQINMNKAAGRKILLVSGRDEECRDMTIDWLQTYDIHFDELLMRPKGSITKDSMVKKEIYLNQIEPRYNVLAVFDDRIQVIKKWNQLGLFVFTCNQGLHDF